MAKQGLYLFVKHMHSLHFCLLIFALVKKQLKIVSLYVLIDLNNQKEITFLNANFLAEICHRVNFRVKAFLNSNTRQGA